VIRYGKMMKMKSGFMVPLIKTTAEIYKEVYPELGTNLEKIYSVVQNEEDKFEKTLESGLKEFNNQLNILKSKEIPGKIVFNLYQSYGFPLELIEELAKEKSFEVDREGFKKEFARHQEISRAGREGKFGGVGKEATYQATKLHTATHLLHQALRQVLGKEVRQMGSDINSERLRFDFSYSQKMTPEQIKKVEEIVNQKIKEDLEVKKEEMFYEEAIKSGALAFFKEKYPEEVNVYSVGDFSKEICAGPHVKKTSELGHFKIIKEESSSAGVRRIRAVLE
jgi:alanyl-tRNA synthetase